MICPAARPTSTTQKRSHFSPMTATAAAVPASTRPPAEKMPVRSAQSSRPIEACSPVRTRKAPAIEATIPIAMISSGSTKASAS